MPFCVVNAPGPPALVTRMPDVPEAVPPLMTSLSEADPSLPRYALTPSTPPLPAYCCVVNVLNAPAVGAANPTSPALLTCCVTVELPVTFHVLLASTLTFVTFSAAPLQREPLCNAMLATAVALAKASPSSTLPLLAVTSTTVACGANVEPKACSRRPPLTAVLLAVTLVGPPAA